PPFPPPKLKRKVLVPPPVEPDRDSASESAPELARLPANPPARASPVSPENPELPETPPPVTAPVSPVTPELPLVATGLPTAVGLAPPVLPVLVADVCEVALPELPLTVSGA